MSQQSEHKADQSTAAGGSPSVTSTTEAASTAATSRPHAPPKTDAVGEMSDPTTHVKAMKQMLALYRKAKADGASEEETAAYNTIATKVKYDSQTSQSNRSSDGK